MLGKSVQIRNISSLMGHFEESAIERFQKLKDLKREETYGLPWTFEGETLKEASMRFASEQMLVKNNISKPNLMRELYQIYDSVLKATGEDRLEDVKDSLEPRLYLHLTQALANLKASGKRVDLEIDDNFPEESKRPTVNSIDSILYRGLKVMRDLNPPINDHHLSTDIDIGLLIFTHKDLSNRFAYVNQARIEELHANNRQTIFQILLWVKSPHKLRVLEGDKLISVYSGDYTYTQQWIFESQCTNPPKLKNENKTENYIEWMIKFKPEKWIVTGMHDFINPLAHFN